MTAALLLLIPALLAAAEYAAPAGARPALRRPGAASILPGGRIIAPLGIQYVTGPGPFGLAVSPRGRSIVSANSGPERFSLTVLEREKGKRRLVRHIVAPAKKDEPGESDDWRSVFMGLAFDGERTLYASEGNSGRVRAINPLDGGKRRVFETNEGGFSDSFTGDLAFDSDRRLIYVLDQANFRLVTIDLNRRRVAASLRLGRLPFAIALSPDRRRAYITNIGMFEYKPVPGAEKKNARETGLLFPAFGFPSPEAAAGARRATPRGEVQIAGLGDPNVNESNSLAIVNLENPAEPKVEAFVRTGIPFGKGSDGGSSPSGVAATADRIFVSNGANDSITVIDAKTNQALADIPIRIPGLDTLRGLLPIGIAYHEPSGWLLVAEAGANAIGVIDTRQMKVIGHLPVGWFPTRILLDGDQVYVTNARGQGTGPNAVHQHDETFATTLRRGTISSFPLPAAAELPELTGRVMAANGYTPKLMQNGAVVEPVKLPDAIRHVVIIVKENRTFDEVFGDIRQAGNDLVAGAPALARLGTRGYADGRGIRLSLQNVNVTPNHHKLASLFSFSDNFYADSDVSVDGHHWLVGSYPNAWTQSSFTASYAGQKDFRLPTSAPGRLLFAESNSSVHPEDQLEAGTIWHHFERNKISFRNFGEGFELASNAEDEGEKPTGARLLTNVPMPDPLYRNTSREYPGFNMNIPDQYRASQFIAEIEKMYGQGKASLPQVLFIHLPNDHMAKARPKDGYPFEASFVADNDYALGRIIEFLSNTPWWREMAIFITEDDAQGGRDHIDAHRTVFLGVGPYFKKGYVSHVNSSFPGMLKTVFRLLGIPPLNLFDATASDLGDCFTSTPDFAPYKALPIDRRLFDPEKAREPLDPAPSPRMDDPRVIQELRR
ncbi:MAG TPA: alkaline phosphatase family protein [Bryobacteraceae bacterium]|nr:alkaline phosphatase family protein [Bryobacteraceae bacterium]